MVIAAVVLTLTACSPGADSSASKARRALDTQRYSEAIAISEANLAAIGGDPKQRRTIWRFERIRVEALARSGDGEGVLTTMDRLSEAFPTHANAGLFLVLAQQLFEADDRVGAGRLLARGAQQFPDDESLLSELATAWKQGEPISREACERLRSLGYLDC
jgi:hypothetical protein